MYIKYIEVGTGIIQIGHIRVSSTAWCYVLHTNYAYIIGISRRDLCLLLFFETKLCNFGTRLSNILS